MRKEIEYATGCCCGRSECLFENLTNYYNPKTVRDMRIRYWPGACYFAYTDV